MSKTSQFRAWLDNTSVLIGIALILLAILLQVAGHAYASEWTSNADEPSHFLSGLLVRDYVMNGLGTSPMKFARDYYSHYPKIGIGNWPPAFYAMQGAWMLVFPDSRASVLVLIAIMMGIVAWIVFRATRPTLGVFIAAFGAVTFLLLPPIPNFLNVVMAEVPLAFFFVASVAFWMRFMETENSWYLFGFGALSVITIMVKGNGIALAFLPPLSILISWRWRILRLPSVWKTAAAVGVLTVPWVIYYLPTMRAGWAIPDQQIGQFSNAMFYPIELYRVLGWEILVIAGIGVVMRLRPPGSSPAHGRLMWSTALAAILACVIFHTVAPGGLFAIRHLIPVFPFIAMFVAAGAHAISQLFERVVPNARLATVLAVALVAFAVQRKVPTFRTATLNGFDAVVDSFLSPGQSGRDLVAMISSDSPGEGALVVETALGDNSRPQSIVWRASKLLALTTWAGRDYKLRGETTSEVMDLLHRARVEIVVIDRLMSTQPHQKLLIELVSERPDRFTLLGEFPLVRGDEQYPDGIAVYRFIDPQPAPRDSTLRQVPGYNGVFDPANPEANKPGSPG